MDYHSVVAAYEKDFPRYQSLAVYAADELERSIKAAGIYTLPIMARAKEPTSFGIKACIGRKYDEPLREIKDKVGVRVMVVYLRDEESVVEVVKSTFSCHQVDRKVDALDYDRNGYLGTHIDVSLTPEQASSLGNDLDSEIFEVQVRTIAESAWAEASHPLLYKPPADVPPPLKRRIYRLVALVELIDSEVEAFRVEAEHTEGYGEAFAVRDMVRRMAELGNSRRPNRLLTLELCAAIVPLYDMPVDEVGALVAAFADSTADGLANIIAESEALDPQDLNPLLMQPELPMICERLDADRINLERVWPVAVPMEWLDDLAEKWGAGRAPQ